MVYDHQSIERRWQAYWEQHETFRVEIDHERPKYYVLDMFPYPSGDGLHVGHVEGYTATDIIARYKRMRGFNVLHPMGWDAFGLPAERHAMKTGVHPGQVIATASANFRRQLKSLGFSYDWRREVNTTDPGYYKWTQWIFLQLWGSFYDRDARKARPIAELVVPDDVRAQGVAAVRRYTDDRRLAYIDEAPVNWCPALRVVLANEEVAEKVDDGYEVIRRPMRQWVLRITEYAERLLEDLEGLDWPPHVLEIQRNWVGRSEGAEIDFSIAGHDAALTVFTTRPDTLYGATYMVLAPEHPLVASITTAACKGVVDAYVDRTARRSERERQAEAQGGAKTGAFTGAMAIHPLTGEQIPIWIADYVLAGYGTGAIMAVPGHDERDHAFARAMGLQIRRVVAPVDGSDGDIEKTAFVGEGTAVNSPLIDGQPTAQAKRTMIDHLVAQGRGRARITYKLRDWLFSRQRYWGEPFPLAHAADGDVFAASELPVLLPEVADYDPSEDGEPPLSRATAWKTLPDGAVRETNTMPQWAGSCWYYLRFCDPSNGALPWSKDAESYWMPVDLYVGGVEHAATHLLYSRFWHKVLFDLGHVGEPEPFRRLVNQGMILGATFLPLDRRKDEHGKKLFFLPHQVEEQADPDNAGESRWIVKDTGEVVEIQWDKMSKSRMNVVNPDEVVATHGADSVRMYEMFMGPLEHSAPWQTEGLAGVHRFLQRVWKLFHVVGDDDASSATDPLRALGEGEGTPRQRRLLHRTIEDVTQRIDRFAFNTAISALMVFVRDLVAPQPEGSSTPQEGALPRDAASQFCLLLAPFAPHLAEELWSELGHARSLAYEPWPAADAVWLADDTFTLVVQINGKWRAEIAAPKAASKDELQQLALAHDEIQRKLAGASPKRVIVVPGRLVNFVV
jgi:leucyl-tRNA synthetase